MIEIKDSEARRASLGEHQRARIEHIAIEVDDLDATLRALEVLGVQPKAPLDCLETASPSGRNRTVATA